MFTQNTVSNDIDNRYKRYNWDMEYQPPVSSSTCKRGCCWTPYTVCARARHCQCHRPWAHEMLAARIRWEKFMALYEATEDDD